MSLQFLISWQGVFLGKIMLKPTKQNEEVIATSEKYVNSVMLVNHDVINLLSLNIRNEAWWQAFTAVEIFKMLHAIARKRTYGKFRAFNGDLLKIASLETGFLKGPFSVLRQFLATENLFAKCFLLQNILLLKALFVLKVCKL